MTCFTYFNQTWPECDIITPMTWHDPKFSVHLLIWSPRSHQRFRCGFPFWWVICENQGDRSNPLQVRGLILPVLAPFQWYALIHNNYDGQMQSNKRHPTISRMTFNGICFAELWKSHYSYCDNRRMPTLTTQHRIVHRCHVRCWYM